MDITPSEVFKEYETEEKKLKPRFDRMDKDFERWDLKKMQYEKGPTAINVTSNRPRTFCDAVQTKLSASERQIAIYMAEEEGEDKRDDIAKLERLLDFALNKADERLVGMLVPPLKDYLIWSSLVRGWMAARILNYKDGKNVIFNYTPLDPRWMVYKTGAEGLSQTSYKTFKSSADLKAVYKYDTPTLSMLNPLNWGRDTDKDSIAVIDRWDAMPDGMWNSVAVEDKWLKEPMKYNYPSMPVLIMPVSTRPPVLSGMGGEEEIAGFGDSIFAPNRGVDELINTFISMWFTHAKLHAKQPLINYYKKGGKTDIDNLILQPEMVINIPVETNELRESPLKEISPTLVNAVALLRSWEEEGSLPVLELTKPPPSGTALSIIEEARSKVYGPQLRLTPIDLKRPHIIQVEHTATTPWTQLDVYQIGDMAKRLGLPDEFVWENILKLQDPKGLSDKAAIEVFEHSPEGIMVKAIDTLHRLGRIDDRDRLIEVMSRMMMAEEATPGGVPPGQEVSQGGGI